MAARVTSLRSFLLRTTPIAFALGMAAVAAAGACSGGAGDAGHGGGDPGGPGGPGGPGSGGSGGELGLNTSSSSSMNSTASGFEECATTAEQATLVPLNMIIMFDRSGSMQDNNKWNDATSALKAFVQTPESAGLRVALRFFPASGCNETNCDFGICSQPEIDAAALTADPAPADAQEAALVTAIDNESPDGTHTPIWEALGGAVLWAKNYIVANPTEKAIVIFVTDGLPNGCNNDVGDIADIAADGYASGVITYGVGLEGSGTDVMDAVAQAGGTGQGIYIGAVNAEQELLEALQTIQGSQVACDFQIPEPAPGEELDPNKVNVTYTASDGTQTTIGQVAALEDCSGTGGWYYDNPAAPSTISFCPSTCQTVQADPEAKINIILGCATEQAE